MMSAWTSQSRFTGKERDSETGLDYFGARYYGSAMGRFTSPDPKMLSSQRLHDPQQWNMYTYTRNNPLLFVDPDGRELTIYVLNHSSYSNKVARQIGEKAAGRFSEAHVKNVTVKVVGEMPKGISGDSHAVVSELVNRGTANNAVEGDVGILRPYTVGHNFGDGKSAVDVNYHYAPGQSVGEVINNAGSDVQHEIAHQYLYGPDGKPAADPNNPGHSPDQNSPMAPGEQVADKPFTPKEQQVLQEKLNKPNEVEKKEVPK
jgi:RHS repeat-associated protein